MVLVTGSNMSIRAPDRSAIQSRPKSSKSICDGLSRPLARGKNTQEVSVAAPGTQRTMRLLPKSAGPKRDGNACTDDRCNGGVCQHNDNTAPCDDGNSCTTADQCSAGVCLGTDLAGQSCDTGLLGECAAGTTACDLGAVTCVAQQQPQPEICGNATDEDCDGTIDDLDACGVTCSPANTVSVNDQTKKTIVALSTAGDRDKVITKGAFALPLGVALSLDGAPVRVEVRDGAGIYYVGVIPADQMTANSSGRVFKFKDRFPPFENNGLQSAKLSVKGTLVKYLFKARSLNLPGLTGNTSTVTVQVGNHCYVDGDDSCTVVADGGGSCR